MRSQRFETLHTHVQYSELSAWQQSMAEQEQVHMLREMAAAIIQRVWRRHSNRQTFAYYRELIAFKHRCDPKQVLRYINPREADLIDAAAGSAY